MRAKPRPRAAFCWDSIAGLVYWFGVCYWIQFVLAYHGGMGDVGGWGLFVLFCLAKALHMGVFALARRDADAALVGRAGGGRVVGRARDHAMARSGSPG